MLLLVGNKKVFPTHSASFATIKMERGTGSGDPTFFFIIFLIILTIIYQDIFQYPIDEALDRKRKHSSNKVKKIII